MICGDATRGGGTIAGSFPSSEMLTALRASAPGHAAVGRESLLAHPIELHGEGRPRGGRDLEIAREHLICEHGGSCDIVMIARILQLLSRLSHPLLADYARDRRAPVYPARLQTKLWPHHGLGQPVAPRAIERQRCACARHNPRPSSAAARTFGKKAWKRLECYARVASPPRASARAPSCWA